MVKGAANALEMERDGNSTPDHAVLDCLLLPIPKTSALLEELGAYLIALWAVVAVIVVIQYGLLARSILIINKHAPKVWRRRSAWVISIYSFMCLMSLGSLVVPASDTVLKSVAIIYMSIGVSQFLDLSLYYFEGEARMLSSLGDKNLPLAVAPVCCCCIPCCPKIPLKKSGLRLIKFLVHQLPFTQSAYFVILLYLFTAGFFVPGKGFPKEIFIPATVFNVASFMSAMYGLNMFTRATRQHLPEYHYTKKAMLMKWTLITVKLQELIFSICISAGAVECTRVMSPTTNGNFIENLVLVPEMVVYGILAHWLYGRQDQYRTAEARYAAIAANIAPQLGDKHQQTAHNGRGADDRDKHNESTESEGERAGHNCV